jgi:hypothetical protein
MPWFFGNLKRMNMQKSVAILMSQKYTAKIARFDPF